MSGVSTRRNVRGELATTGYSFLRAPDIELSTAVRLSLQAMLDKWDTLPPDEYLENDGNYRFRRHGAFRYDPGHDTFETIPDGYYYQSASTNRFVGGIQRVFGPLDDETTANPFLLEFLRFCLAMLPVELTDPWRADVHLVRVVGREGMSGKPTPEGIHNDGFDYVSLHLIERHQIEGGETFVYQDDTVLDSWVLRDPLDSVFVDDRRLLHYVTPITPTNEELVGRRDTLLLSFVRENGHARPA